MDIGKQSEFENKSTKSNTENYNPATRPGSSPQGPIDDLGPVTDKASVGVSGKGAYTGKRGIIWRIKNFLLRTK